MLLRTDRSELTSLRGLVVRILRALSLFITFDALNPSSHGNKSSTTVLTDRRNGGIDDLRHLVTTLFHPLKYFIRLIAHRYAVLVPHKQTQAVPNNNVIAILRKKRG